MRNLKKILALVLALVMSLSLMATASATDFKDDGQINDTYKTAAEVLAGLEVFRGDPDGSFRPTDSISRAETAAIIYRIVTGDVDDKQVGIYADYNLFTDVPSDAWFAGYVNYCANAEYIKGNGDGTFSPDEKVTGYAALAMILRAIGYTANGGFTGDDWEVQTARTAEARKITKNILTGTLGQPATRESVAEILFQAILVNMVDHNILNTNNGNQGYTEINETLGYKTFKLEQIEGVVTGNEYADLNSDQVLAEGKTQIELADGTIKNLDITTEITDIGESRYAYITGAKVLATGDTGLNKVTEFGSACDISTTAKFNAVAEMTKASDIEFYVNFDRSGYWTSDFRIEYEMSVGETTEAWRNEYVDENGGWFTDDGATYHKLIPATDTITNTDYDNIRNIFYVSNGKTNTEDKTTAFTYIGKVFVGTQTKDDVSDEISFNQFVEKYLNDKTFNDNWGVSYNGQWVKFVDNNGDGQAEYAFKTQSWLDEALETYTNKDGETVTVFNWFDDNDDPRSINGEYQVRYMNGEVPAVGTKVIAAWIDNQILVEPANDETATVSSYSWRDDVITTDKGEFGQSGIQNATDMLQYIATMADKTEYVMYLDHFGYVRAYEYPGASNYVLVTEIYARNNANGNLVRDWPMTVELAIPNAESNKAEPKEYSLNGGGSNLFVSEYPWSLIWNLAATSNYYNWLQPATAHMGVSANGLAPRYAVPAFGSETFLYWETNRALIRQINTMSAPANATGYDTFNYGPISDVTNNTTSFTNIAIATIDGESATLEGAARVKYNKDGSIAYYNDGTNTRARYAVDYVQLSTALPVAAGAVRYPIGGTSAYVTANNDYVNAVHDTEYYIVHDDGVEYFKDFTNMPALTADNVGEIHAAYAVAKDISSDNADAPYWVADVIVYEVQNWNNDKAGSVALAYYTDSRTSGNVQNIDTINAKYGLVSLNPRNKAWSADQGQWGIYWDGYGFYKLTNETEPVDSSMTASKITRITYGSYADNAIHAGTVIREAYLAGNGYYIDVDMSYANAQPWVGARNAATPLIVSIEITDKIYSVTTDTTHQGYWYDYNEAELLRYQNANNSQVKAGDLVVWIGEAKGAAVSKPGVLSSTNFVVDLGNPDTNADLFNASASFLLYNDVQWQGEWIEIMREQNTPDATVNSEVTFYGVKAALDNGVYTATVPYATAQTFADGYNITVADGTIVMADTTINDSKTSAATTLSEGEAVYTGTILNKDGKTYYTYRLIQEGKVAIPEDMEVYSTNPAIAVVARNDDFGTLGAGVDGRLVTYKVTIQDPEQLTINNLQKMLAATAGCTVTDLQAYDQTLTLDNYGTPISKDQTCATAMWFNVTVANAAGTTMSILIYRDQTSDIDPGTTYTVSIPNYASSGIKAYWSWPNTPVESSAIRMDGTTAKITVVDGGIIAFAVSDLEMDLGDKTATQLADLWTATDGVGKMAYWHPEEDNTCTMTVYVNGKNITGVAFTAPTAPVETGKVDVPDNINTTINSADGFEGLGKFLVTPGTVQVKNVEEWTGAEYIKVSGTIPADKQINAVNGDGVNFPGFGADFDAVVSGAKAHNPNFYPGDTVPADLKVAFYAFTLLKSDGSAEEVVMVVSNYTETGTVTVGGTAYTIRYDLTWN